MKKLKKIAAYDEQAVWGTGHTDSGALSNAREFRDGRKIIGCKTAEMSPYLAEYVEINGGDVGFTLDETGILCFIDDDGLLI